MQYERILSERTKTLEAESYIKIETIETDKGGLVMENVKVGVLGGSLIDPDSELRPPILSMN